MDWTSIYAESGEEEFIIQNAPRISRLVSAIYFQPRNHTYSNNSNDANNDLDFEQEEDYASHRMFEISSTYDTTTIEKHNNENSSPYTLGALYCLTINYILGVGCLGVPYAFARAGFLLCGIIIVAVTILSFWTVMWVAEAGMMLELFCENEGEKANFSKEEERNLETEVGEEAALLSKKYEHNDKKRLLNSGEQSSIAGSNNRSFDSNQYEVIDLVSYFLGPRQAALYQCSLLALMYVGLLAFTQVFCGALSAVLPSIDENDSVSIRWFWSILPQIVFGTFVLPLSCAELDEQISIQVAMAMMRFVAIFLMIAGSIIGIMSEGRYAGKHTSNDNEHFTTSTLEEEEQFCWGRISCFSGFGVAFSTALFSQLFQHSVPGLLRPLKQKHCNEYGDNIRQVPFIFAASLFTTCMFYLFLGVTAASFFGPDTHPSVNLNFANFNFGFGPSAPPILQEVGHVASTIVVMFPALDTLSVFPLIANTLGNNLLATSSPSLVRKIRTYMKGNGCKQSPTLNPVRLATIFWRLVAAFPPLIVSFYANDLSLSMLFAGVAGLYVAFFVPAMLKLESKKKIECNPGFKVMVEEGESIKIFSTGLHSRTSLAYAVLAFATFAVGDVSFQIFQVLKR